MWSYLRAMSVLTAWTIASWYVATRSTTDLDRPGDDNQFARWLDEKEGVTDGKA